MSEVVSAVEQRLADGRIGTGSVLGVSTPEPTHASCPTVAAQSLAGQIERALRRRLTDLQLRVRGADGRQQPSHWVLVEDTELEPAVAVSIVAVNRRHDSIVPDEVWHGELRIPEAEMASLSVVAPCACRSKCRETANLAFEDHAEASECAATQSTLRLPDCRNEITLEPFSHEISLAGDQIAGICKRSCGGRLPTPAELRFVSGCSGDGASRTVPCRDDGAIERCRLYPSGGVYRDRASGGGDSVYRHYYCVLPRSLHSPRAR